MQDITQAPPSTPMAGERPKKYFSFRRLPGRRGRIPESVGIPRSASSAASKTSVADASDVIRCVDRMSSETIAKMVCASTRASIAITSMGIPMRRSQCDRAKARTTRMWRRTSGPAPSREGHEHRGFRRSHENGGSFSPRCLARSSKASVLSDPRGCGGCRGSREHPRTDPQGCGRCSQPERHDVPRCAGMSSQEQHPVASEAAADPAFGPSPDPPEIAPAFRPTGMWEVFADAGSIREPTHRDVGSVCRCREQLRTQHSVHPWTSKGRAVRAPFVRPSTRGSARVQ